MDYSLTPCTKVNSKWIKDLNIRHETIKFLEENIGSMLFDISLSNSFLDMSPQAREIKGKINKWDYRKLKGFHTVKEIINKTKRPLTEWEKRFANNVYDKVLTSTIHKELIQLHTKKQTTRLKNGQRI